jgi:hypothetical protein
LIVSNAEILDGRFSMRRVLDHLAQQLRGDPAYTGATLFRDWWDLQNDDAHSQGGPLHCSSSLNGFPVACPRQEGTLASVGLVDSGADSWVPIALFSRFDLAPAGGAHCGEYRIEFGKVARLPGGLDRVLVIFEAQMPNPDPARGRDGCDSIAGFWARLSGIADQASRATQITIAIRARRTDPHEPVHDRAAILRARRARAALAAPRDEAPSGMPRGICIEQVTVKNNPFGDLFSDSSGHPRAAEFQAFFATPEVVAALGAGDLNAIAISTSELDNAGQSTSQGTENDYRAHFAPEGTFALMIQDAIDVAAMGDPSIAALRPRDIVERAGSMSCAGCHQLSNNDRLGDGLVWPPSFVFTHVSETDRRPCEPDAPAQGQYFVTSPALDGTFLPGRRQIMQQFLLDP